LQAFFKLITKFNTTPAPLLQHSAMQTISLPNGTKIDFRDATPDDKPLLHLIYSSSREEEMALVTQWDEAQKAAFIRQQFEAQYQYYAEMYASARFMIILHHTEAAGRLYLHFREKEIRIVDIALLRPFRNKGIGEAILRAVLARGAALQLPVTIHVERYNQALRLYQRLGFKVISEEHPVYFLMAWRPEEAG
jgi:ribosomal protein S18 acetylase RimI-like enzyme